MVIFSAINGNNIKNPVPQPPLDLWTRMNISQTLENSQYLFQITIESQPLRGTLSLRKPVPAILAFISHFRLKQLDLRNDQVHVDRLAAVL